MTKVIITGAKGRMGQTLIACAKQIPELQVVGQIDLGDHLGPLLDKADAVIDFSFHEATLPFAHLCVQHGKALIVGTTGHAEKEKAELRACAAKIPMVWASNYSTGVNTLFWLTRKAAEILGPSFDLEVVEMHHRMKKDAPSGTFGRSNSRMPSATDAKASPASGPATRLASTPCAAATWWATTPSSSPPTASGWNSRTRPAAARPSPTVPSAPRNGS
jgi:dihydrodipicolinate reductase